MMIPKKSPKSAKGMWEQLIQDLMEEGLLTQKDLDRAVLAQKDRGGSLSQLLIDMKLVDSKALTGVLSRVLRIPTISLSKLELDTELGQLITRKLAYHYQVVPVARVGKQLTVAMSDPMNVMALDYLAQQTGLELTPMIAPPEEIQEALHRLYGGAIADSIEELATTATPGSGLELISEEADKQKERMEDLVRLTQQVPVVRVTNAILSKGVNLKASDILVEPFERRLRIRYRVDGLFREGESPPSGMHTGIVSRLKIMSSLNIAEHRLPQDGRIKFSVGNRDVDFRVSVIPSYYGEKVCLRILDKTQVMLDINRLGFESDPMQVLKDAVQHPHGMLLITGPTGSGKTTTLYSLLKMVDRPECNLVTVEDPVEFDMHGVNQVTVRPDIELTFAATLRSILRQDPDIILIGEIRDSETADIAVKAALTGHLVLSTLHTNDALGAVARLSNMGVDPYLIASSVLLVGAQRLPRCVCPACKKQIHPSKEIVDQLGLVPNGVYQRGKGCDECRGSGLAGRIGLLEAVPLTAELKRLISEGQPTMKLRQVVHAAGIPSLRDHAVAKAAAGLIPLEEVARTTVGYQE